MRQAKLRNIRVRKCRDAGPACGSSVPIIPSPPATTVGVLELDLVGAGDRSTRELSSSVAVFLRTDASVLLPEITRLESIKWSLLFTFGTSMYCPADPMRPDGPSRTATRNKYAPGF